MSDLELERHIESCGALMLAAYARYEASGSFADRGEADAWRMEMERAIGLRGAAQVAEMEVERGFAA